MQERSKLGAVLACKCPKCRQGDIFQTKAHQFWSNRKIHQYCPVCNELLEPEPGFYFGAMYISYAFSVGIALVTGFILYNFFNDPDITVYFGTVLVIVLASLPLMYRWSRSIFLHLFGGIKRDPAYK